MLYESEHVTLAAEYRIGTLTVLGGIDRAVLDDLDAALAVADQHRGLEMLVLRYGKSASGFAFGNAVLGQRVAARLAGLDAITVAEIDGPCLGGALELALACDVRVAAGHARTRFGFPQVPSGAVPCWGGTVRLPKQVGMSRALDLFLSGRKLSASEARTVGLVQYAFPPSVFRPECDRLVLELQATGKKPRQRKHLVDLVPGRRSRLLRRAWTRVEATVSPDHKAPRDLLRILMAGVRGGEAEGLAAERAAALLSPPPFAALLSPPPFAALLSPPPLGGRVRVGGGTSHSLTLLPPTLALPHKGGGDKRTIRRVGVIGGGTIGAALAQWAAVHGCTVTIQERNDASAKLARERLAKRFREAVNRRLISAADAADRIAAIPIGSGWIGFEDADLVIEAVDEDRAAKSEVLQKAERHVPPTALLATCSTAFTVRELQDGLARPQRLLGLHVGHPAATMRWVELTAGPATDPGAIARLRSWLSENGKQPLLVTDRPGRVLGRVLLPYLHEALLLAQEGFDLAGVDAAMRKFGMAWGPFEALDAAGSDVILATLRAMSAGVHDINPPPVLERLVSVGSNRRGRAVSDDDLALAVRRLVARLLAAAFTALGFGLVRDADELDGLLLGAGWPAFRGGPIHFAQGRGLPAVVRTCEQLARECGPRFEPGRELRRRPGLVATPPAGLRAA